MFVIVFPISKNETKTPVCLLAATTKSPPLVATSVKNEEKRLEICGVI